MNGQTVKHQMRSESHLSLVIVFTKMCIKFQMNYIFNFGELADVVGRHFGLEQEKNGVFARSCLFETVTPVTQGPLVRSPIVGAGSTH